MSAATVGRICEIVRYPVKSMAGVACESAFLGWHGLDGDRRFAFRRLADESGFPFLTASRAPELILYRPIGLEDAANDAVPTHVRTPSGSEIELRSPGLVRELSGRFGSDLELHHFRNGIFDEGAVSVICSTTTHRPGGRRAASSAFPGEHRGRRRWRKPICRGHRHFAGVYRRAARARWMKSITSAPGKFSAIARTLASASSALPIAAACSAASGGSHSERRAHTSSRSSDVD